MTLYVIKSIVLSFMCYSIELNAKLATNRFIDRLRGQTPQRQYFTTTDFHCSDSAGVERQYEDLLNICVINKWQYRKTGEERLTDKQCCAALDTSCLETALYTQECNVTDGLSESRREFTQLVDWCRTDANIDLTDDFCLTLNTTAVNATVCRLSIGCRISDTLFATTTTGPTALPVTPFTNNPSFTTNSNPGPNASPTTSGDIIIPSKNTGARNTCALSLAPILVVIILIHI